jgi:hypothetical protein
VIANSEMIALCLDVGINDLIVEKLRGLRPPGNTPIVIIEQSAEEHELPLLIQDFDLHEIRKLPSECLHVLFEPSKIPLDMRTQERLDVVVGELAI